MPTETTSETDLASQILVLVGYDPRAFEPGVPPDLFRQATKKQLLDCAQRLGLTGLSKLGKEDLAERVHAAFEGLPAPRPRMPTGADPVPINGGGAFPQKFDLGPTTEPAELPQNIPWGYGRDRVTAMVVDPDRLFVYWEVTDQSAKAARASLGRGGPSAWFNLRIYDISGRLFDGTNAHSYFDNRVEHHDRQWFFAINKPTSAACVEVGLLSDEGFFAKIARSARADFPRKEPVGGGPVEWLSVRTASGAVGMPTSGAKPAPPPEPSPAPAPATNGVAGTAPGGTPPAAEGWSEWNQFTGFPVPAGQRVHGRRWEWQEESGGTQWTSELAKTEWVGPVLRSEWEAGPFTYPVEAPSLVEYRDSGELSVRMEGGQVHVVYGPWQVVIRGIGAHTERRVLSTWEYRRQVELVAGTERSLFAMGGAGTAGSSDLVMMGSSERSWRGASELVFRGGSELWMLGASELVFRGSSETLFAGASEYRYRGASESLLMGASERLLRGASERRIGGASESMFAGASERARGGASELFGGASERLGGASERRGGASEQLVPRSERLAPAADQPLEGARETPTFASPGSPYPMPGRETD